MTFSDLKLIPATLTSPTLGGVPFLFREIQTAGGRRTIEHRLINQDLPYIEDIGGISKRFAIEAFFVGENYTIERNRMIAILESDQSLLPLVFVHPLLGTYQVKLLGEYAIGERDTEGAVCSLTLTLVAVDPGVPQITNFRPPGVGVPGAIINAALRNQILRLIGLGMASAAIAANALGPINTALRAINGTINGALGLVDQFTYQLNAIEGNINNLTDTVDVLEDQLDLKIEIFDSIGNYLPVSTADPDGVEQERKKKPVDVAMNAFRVMNFDIESPSIPVNAEDYVLEKLVFDQIDMANKITNVVAVMGAIELLELDNATQALSIQEELLDTLDEFRNNDDLTNDLLEKLENLRSAIIDYFIEQQRQLPLLDTFVPKTTLPALVIAWDLYEDATQATDIVDRNNISNPAFVPGGVELEVIAP